MADGAWAASNATVAVGDGTATGNSTESPDDESEKTREASAEAGLTRLWTSRADDLVSFLESAQNLQHKAEDLAAPLTGKVQKSRAQFTRLKGLFQASRGHPTEQLTLVEQMHSAFRELQSTIRPLEQISVSINERQEEVIALQKDLSSYPAESMSVSGAEGKEAEALQTYTQTLNSAANTLNAASRRLETIVAPAKNMLDRMTVEIKEIDNSMVDIWENYYLATSENTLASLTEAPQLLADWVASLSSRMAFAYPQTLEEWEGAAKNFSIAGLIMAILGILCFRGAAGLPDQWREACRNVISKAWVFIGFGLAVLAASNNHYGGIYFAFVLFGGLIVIWGIGSMSWRLRIVVQPSLENENSPLSRLYNPAATGVLMLFSDLPTRILGIVWGLFLLIFIIITISYNSKKKEQDTPLPLLENISYRCTLWFGIASLLITLFGQARLAILSFMILFALVNFVTLASSLMALFELFADRVFPKAKHPISSALAGAASVPVACLLSLLCALPWIWAVPGARYLLQYMMSTNYTVGDVASFDFSKIIIIIFLFFLFRSFITLGRTSLEQLPDRMPNIERGVIPPLGTLLTYGLWVLFAIIALGMLGVNFTSLAVVAGGLSVGIGFGLQNIFNNLVSGIMLIFGRTLLVGDYVEVGGVAGTVKAISIRSTTLETAERALIYVPNSSLMAGQFTNWTRNSRMVRRSLVIGVAYGSNTALVKEVLLETAKKHNHVLVYPEPAVLFTNFGDNALEFMLNVFIDDFNNATSTLSDLRLELDRRFVEHGIDIPFPQLTLHVPDAGQAAQAENASLPDAAEKATGKDVPA